MGIFPLHFAQDFRKVTSFSIHKSIFQIRPDANLDSGTILQYQVGESGVNSKAKAPCWKLVWLENDYPALYVSHHFWSGALKRRIPFNNVIAKYNKQSKLGPRCYKENFRLILWKNSNGSLEHVFSFHSIKLGTTAFKRRWCTLPWKPILCTWVVLWVLFTSVQQDTY